MSKLIKKLENETDYIICVFKMNSGKFVVTIYDYVSKTHDKQGSYDDYNEALSAAKSLNNQYKINENTVKLTESKLKQIVAESVNKVLNEDDFLSQIKGSIKRGNTHEIAKTYNDLTTIKNCIHLLYFGQGRLNKEVSAKLESAAEIIEKYLTEDVINAIINGIRQHGIHGKDRKPIDYSIPMRKRHHLDDPEHDFEPEDWYERVEHGDFDEN
jgi:hypothetical protein